MLAVILNQHLIKRRKQEEYKTAHSSPPDYETKNIVFSSDGVSCAEKDDTRKPGRNIFQKNTKTKPGRTEKQEFSKSWIRRRKAQATNAKAKKIFLKQSEIL